MPITEVPGNQLYNEYLPFRLYAEHGRGTSIRDIARKYGLSESWTAERIEAARLCHLQVEIKPASAAA